MKAINDIGELDEEELPECFKPTHALVFKVSKIYNDIKSDVMDFYNVSLYNVFYTLPVLKTLSSLGYMY